MSENVLPPLPKGTRPLSHQVAGHFFGRGKHRYGFLESEDGSLLKPVQSPPRGPRELKFYQQVFDPHCKDSVLLKLRPLLPTYLGTWTTEAHPDVTYFQLHDITKKFRHPNILDVKIGPITYDPDATPEKIAHEKSKYPPLAKVCFQIIGMRTYDPQTGQSQKVERTFLRSLDEEQILWKGLASYVNYSEGSQSHHPVVQGFLHHLQKIKSWFDTQTQLSFYASSLLLVHEGAVTEPEKLDQTTQQINSNGLNNTESYDGDMLTFTNATSHSNARNSGDNSQAHSTYDPCDEHTDYSEVVDVRMIDFAHVFPTNVCDSNYLAGLNSLISYFEKLLA